MINQSQNVIANKLNYETVPKLQSYEALQVGDYKLSARSVDYNGWLICNGRMLNVEDYPELYEIIGTNFGGGEGEFRLPDFTSRVIGMFGVSAVAGSGLTTRSQGDEVGNETINLTVGQLAAHSHTGTTASDGSHVHGVTDPGHSHTYGGVQSQGAASGLDNVAENSPRPTETTSTSETGVSINTAGAHTHTFTTNDTGNGDDIDVMQPTLFGVSVMIFSKFVDRDELEPTPW
jgi:microcystin-dependent protein